MAISRLSKLTISQSLGKNSSIDDPTADTDSYVLIDYVLVGGGGSGGEGHGGGGGGGGVVTGQKNIVKGETYNITIGTGGIQRNSGSNALGNYGNPTRAFELVASGGGAGGGYDLPTWGGASGGGQGGGLFGSAIYPLTVASGLPGQGKNGGIYVASNGPGNGGGGAGSDGTNGSGVYPSTSDGGNGGNGIDISSYLGQSAGTTYVGGGGGGGGARTRGLGGLGGGGNGGQYGATLIYPTGGTANTGGGGGGGSADGSGAYRYGMEGGSGIVIVKTLASAVSITGSSYTTTTSGAYNIYRFLADGSITF